MQAAGHLGTVDGYGPDILAAAGRYGDQRQQGKDGRMLHGTDYTEP
jgi:hypothetical protein